MPEVPNRPCVERSPEKPPRLLNVDAPQGIRLKEYLFLATLPPCCAQSALPYWAKVTGVVANRTLEDIVASVTVTLMNLKGAPLAAYVDTVFLDAGETSSFEVKLTEFRDTTVGYSIDIESATSLS
jgi:hypothetical protein